VIPSLKTFVLFERVRAEPPSKSGFFVLVSYVGRTSFSCVKKRPVFLESASDCFRGAGLTLEYRCGSLYLADAPLYELLLSLRTCDDFKYSSLFRWSGPPPLVAKLYASTDMEFGREFLP